MPVTFMLELNVYFQQVLEWKNVPFFHERTIFRAKYQTERSSSWARIFLNPGL